MAKRFEKKKTDTRQIEKEEKKIGAIKVAVTIASTILGGVLFVVTKGHFGRSTKV